MATGVADLLTAPSDRVAKAPQAVQALSGKLLMSTCAAATPLPNGDDGALCMLCMLWPATARCVSLTSSAN